ncbi:MAG TPA: stage II sporulation protein M [Gemmatimonadales bacterium]|nr:stage II sporulation protein M [Gemmatimonadales bacterium]
MNAPARVEELPTLEERYEVETPEQVAMGFTLAGLGSRLAAALTDLVVLFIISVLVSTIPRIGSFLGNATRSWAFAFVLLFSGLGFFLYFFLFETLAAGRTPGKRLVGIRVVLDSGRRLTTSASAVRNLLRFFDEFFPFAPTLPGILFVFFTRSRKRLGDLAAGTIVVRDRATDWSPVAALPPTPVVEETDLGPPLLAEQEFRLVDTLLARFTELDPVARTRIAIDVATRLESRIPRNHEAPEVYLTRVFTEEGARRRSRFGGLVSARQPGRVGVTGERFVERKREMWEGFRAKAKKIEGAGVTGLSASDIPGFAAQYREVAADLARARTYGVPTPVIGYLERLVAAGHTAMYRNRAGGRDRQPLWPVISREFPGAVLQSWRYVLTAFLMFVIPGIVGYTLVRSRPDIADEIAPPVMVSRAQAAADREARGIGYAQSPEEALPEVAAFIIQNNIKVCFVTFAGGLLAGLLTVLSLVANGLSLGVGLGVFTNYHAASYLLTFVAGHGVLELTAIFISGGAGFRLAHALIAPGDRTRRDALVIDGRIAVKMIGMVVVLLGIAGTIEGLLSASDAPATVKFGVSGTSAVFLLLYLANGWRNRTADAGQRSQPGRAALA